MKKYIYIIIISVSIFQNFFLFANNASDYVDVKKFGAKGDGKNDDTQAIQKAIYYGAEKGQIVVFPKGIYLVNKLIINASLKGNDQVILKRPLSKVHGHYDFCIIGNQKNLTISNLIFDANSASNQKIGYNKGIPLFVYSSKNIQILTCEFRNSSMSGLRIESSSNISVTHSRSLNSKGNFGDGFYFAKSKEIIVKNSDATEYTRAGFVVENNSSEVTFDNCIASFGRNASILKGGGEYNAGFWYENSYNVFTKNCISRKNTHLGFVASGTNKDTNLATFSFDNCISENNPIGFRVSSSKNVPVRVKISNSKSVNVDRGFVATANNLKDNFEFENCEVHMNSIPSKALNNIAFMWESPVSKDDKNFVTLPTFVYSNSRIIYDKNEKLNILTNSKANNGDISTYIGGSAKIIIQDVSNNLTGAKLFLKSRRGKPTYLRK